jgi:GT2 family glycosyltransferase
LESISRQSFRNLETIIVDDGSTDGSYEEIAERFPEVVVLRGDGNLWWAAATNLGVKEALSRGADFVFTVNNDVVLSEDAISASVSCALREAPALIGSTVYSLEDPQQIWFAGAFLSPRTCDIEHEKEPILGPEGIRETQMLTGMGMLIPAESLERVGYFDQDAFPHYMADCDFSLRAAKKGYRLLVSADSRIFNEVASAWTIQQMERPQFGLMAKLIFSRRSAYWLRGRIRFYRRHWGRGKVRALFRLYVMRFRTYVSRAIARRMFRRRRGRA